MTTEAMSIERAAKDVPGWLGQAGLRPTRQRVALAKLLVGDGQHRHVTAESLFEATQQGGERVSLATVYNTLRSFSEVGLIREITINGTKSYFDTNTSDHAHFYSEDTGDLCDAHGASVRVEDMPQPPEGTEISKVDVVIRVRSLR
ncbi:MAG: transcriptional repressor [Rhodobacterales bacterium]|nr:MAG: transcriptional repressor [Rhodobacterales bacterium]